MIKKNKNLAQNIIGIYFAIPETVESESVGSKSFHRKITFKEGYDWKQIQITPGSGNFKEVPSSKSAGTLYKQTVNAFSPGEDENNLELFAKITNRLVLLKIVYTSGQTKLIGNYSGPKLKLLPSLAIGLGKSGRSLVFTGNDTHVAYWLEE